MEQYPKSPKEALVVWLSSDFTSEANRRALADAQPGSLAAFLANARTYEDIEERMTSAESQHIGSEVQTILEPSFVTDSFKGFIINKIREAYAYQKAVSEAISPDRLRLRDATGGIFGPDEAEEIEAQCLRGNLHDIIRAHIIMAVSEDGSSIPIVKGPADYTEKMTGLNSWLEDFVRITGPTLLKMPSLMPIYLRQTQRR